VSDVLAVLEHYYDAVPRSGSDVEEVGPFTLFRSRMPWPYYARPRLGVDVPIAVDDVRRLLARMDTLGLPHAIEWVDATTPSLATAAVSAGLSVERYPLLVLASLHDVSTPSGVEIRALDADDPFVPAAVAVAHVGFAAAGTDVGPESGTERDALLSSETLTAHVDATRQMLLDGLAVLVVAIDGDGGVVASGQVSPRGDVAEVVGVATLPAVRRRGIAAAITARLVSAARDAGASTVFLSAGSEAVARVYRHVGFNDIGTACIASSPILPD
jgi:GNAT superfamily N-acetyltransferase